ncbi:hypothetical protein ADK38_14145, partial [Streptomyces varsoviensis]
SAGGGSGSEGRGGRGGRPKVGGQRDRSAQPRQGGGRGGSGGRGNSGGGRGPAPANDAMADALRRAGLLGGENGGR